MEYLKQVENPLKVGYSQLQSRWFPHKSAEGAGSLTIGYGHKLTKDEHASWLLTIPRKPTKSDPLNRRRNRSGALDGTEDNSYVVNWKTEGLTEMDVDNLLASDVGLHREYAEDLWNAASPEKAFSSLSEKYQTILCDWVFATGYLHNKPLIRAILAGDDERVYNAMVLHVNGKPMHSRRDALAKAVGLEIN